MKTAVIISDCAHEILACAQAVQFECTVRNYDQAWWAASNADRAETILDNRKYDLVILDARCWVGTDCIRFVEEHLVCGEQGPVVLIIEDQNDDHADVRASCHRRVLTHKGDRSLSQQLDELRHVSVDSFRQAKANSCKRKRFSFSSLIN